MDVLPWPILCLLDTSNTHCNSASKVQQTKALFYSVFSRMKGPEYAAIMSCFVESPDFKNKRGLIIDLEELMLLLFLQSKQVSLVVYRGETC